MRANSASQIEPVIAALTSRWPLLNELLNLSSVDKGKAYG